MARKDEEVKRLAVELTLESQSFQKKMTTINGLVRDADKEFKAAGRGVEGFEKTFVGLSAKVDKVGKQIDLYNIKLEEQQKRYSELENILDQQVTELNRLEQELGKTSKEYKNQEALVLKNSQTLIKLSTDIKFTEATLRQLDSELSSTNDAIKNFGNETESLNDIIEKNNEKFELQESELKKIASAMDSSASSYNKIQNELLQMAVSLEKNAANIEAYKKELSTLESELSQNMSAHMKLKIEINATERELESASNAYGANSLEAIQLSKKLASLKDDFQRVGTEISEQQSEYRRLNTELNNVQTEFNEVAKEMKRLPFEETSNKLKDVGDKMSKLSATATAVGGAAVAAFGESSNALGKIKISLGQTAEEADKTLESVRDLAEDGFNFEDALSVMIKVKQSMSDLLDDKEINNFSSGVLAISQGFEKDFNDVLKTANSLMRNFGVNSEKSLDIIKSGLQNTGDLSGDLLDSLSEYSVQFNELGFTAEETLAIINAGYKDGAFNTDKLADGIKEFNIKMKEMGNDQKSVMTDLNLNINEVQSSFTKGGDSAKNMTDVVVNELLKVEDETTRYQMAVALFGTMYEDLGDSILGGLSAINDETHDVTGATEEARQVYEETFGAQMNAKIQQLKEPLTLLAQEGLLPILDVAGEMLTKFSEWFTSLDSGTIEAIAKMGMFTMVLSPVATKLGEVINTSATLFDWINKLGQSSTSTAGSTGMLAQAMQFLAGPVGIGLAIAALVALISYVGDCENSLLFLQEKFGGVGTVVAGVCEFVSGLTQLTIGNILSWIQLGVDAIAALIDGPGGQTIEGAWQNHLSRIEKNNTDGMQKITLTTTRGMSQMLNASESSLNLIKASFDSVLGQLDNITRGNYNAAATEMAKQLKLMDSNQLTILRGMNDTCGSLFKDIRSNMTVEEQTRKIEQNLNQMSQAGKLDTDTFKTDLNSAMEKIQESLSDKSQKGSEDVVKNVGDMVKDASQDAKTMEKDFVASTNSMKNSATSTSKKMADQMIADYNRIKSTYSRSISTNVTINQRTIKSSVNAQSNDIEVPTRIMNPIAFGKSIDYAAVASNTETRARGFVAQTSQIINETRNNNSLDNRLKNLIDAILKKSDGVTVQFNIENMNANKIDDLNKIADFIKKIFNEEKRRTERLAGIIYD